MQDSNFIYMAVIGVYILAIFFISWWRSRGIKSQEEFMVAGRSSPAWLLVGSLICTWVGAGSLIGGGGRLYREGLSQLWMSAGAWIGIIIIYFLADKVRKMSQYTVPDILERRYHPAARVLGAIAVILGSTIIFGYQLKGVAFVLEYIFGIEQIYGIIITGIIILGFTIMAGLKSILAMDMLNGILIILAVFIGIPVMLLMVGGDAGMAGGVDHVIKTLPEQHFTMLGGHNLFWALGVFFPTLFLLLGESSIYQKFYSAKDGKSVKRAVLGFLVGVIILESALAVFAIVSSSHPEMAAWRNTHDAYVEAVEAEAPAAELDQKWTTFQETVVTAETARTARPADTRTALKTADSLYKNRTDSINLRSAFVLPIWAGALLLAGGMAIVFSTGASFMMAASTSFTRDILQRFSKKEIAPGRLVWIQRIVMIVLVVFSILILTAFTTVWQMALAAYTIIGATLTPVILAAFLWKRVTAAGGVASLASGLSVWVVMVALIMSGVIDLDYDYLIYPAGGASILALIVVSLLTKPSDPELIKQFTNKPVEE